MRVVSGLRVRSAWMALGLVHGRCGAVSYGASVADGWCMAAWSLPLCGRLRGVASSWSDAR